MSPLRPYMGIVQREVVPINVYLLVTTNSHTAVNTITVKKIFRITMLLK